MVGSCLNVSRVDPARHHLRRSEGEGRLGKDEPRWPGGGRPLGVHKNAPRHFWELRDSESLAPRNFVPEEPESLRLSELPGLPWQTADRLHVEPSVAETNLL